MWRATRISADAANKMQMNAGLLVKNFDIENPVAPADSDIVCDTTGDFSITCQPETEDFFEDVNNAATNMKEGKHITGWNCSLSVTSLSITAETLKIALGAADIDSEDNDAVNPRIDYRAADFIQLYWLGDMVDEDKLMVVVMDNTVSTGGISFTSTNKGKGGLSLELSPHASVDTQDKVPMAFYILEKSDSSSMGTITVTSAAGTSSGTTKITLSNYTPGSGESYVYKVDTTAPTIGYNDTPDYSWTAWNGSADIPATTGRKITIASINASGKAVASGSATVTARS